MGYNFFPVIVKCLFGSPNPVVPTHCAAIVTIDNKRYYVDVGLGLPSPVVPVALCEDSEWQPAAISPHYYSYKMHQKGNTILLEGYNGSKRMSMVSFVPQPVELVDYIPLNYYACMAETSPVTQGIIVEMFKDKGIACILKDRHCYKGILQSGMTRMEAHQLYESKGFNGESKRAFDMRLD